MLKAYKYFLLPTEEQRQQLAKFFGSCRFVYNLGLETKLQAWASARKHLTCIDLANQMKELKDRSWTCQSCGTHHERDENAAKNIKSFGLRIKPSTVNVSH